MVDNSLLTIGVLVVLAGGSVAGYVDYQAGFEEYLEELHWNGRHTSWSVSKAGYDKYSVLLNFDIEYVSFESLKQHAEKRGAGLKCDTEAQVIWTYRDVSPGQVEIRVYRHNDLNSVTSYLSNLVSPP